MTIFFANKPSAEDVEYLEKNACGPLPVAYIDFIKKFNGVFLVDNFFDLECALVDDGLIAFESLFGLGTSNDSFNVMKQNAFLKDEIHQFNAWVIGADGGGNFFVLNLDSDQIYYWDRTYIHIVEGSKEGVFINEEGGNIYLFQESFEAFFELLRFKTKEMDYVKRENWPE